jgi:peptide deformylase
MSWIWPKSAAVPLVRSDDGRLRVACRPVGRVRKEHVRIASNLLKTMLANNGIGIAAPQIGRMERICIVMRDLKPGLAPCPLFDPVIVAWSKTEIEIEEGCLSFPGETVRVRRREGVIVEHKTPLGRTVETPFYGLEAACAQHEIDHLNGIVMHMRAR